MTEREPVRFDTVSPMTGRRVGVSLYPEKQGGLSCYFRDIEEEKRDEERLRQLTEGMNLIGWPESAVAGHALAPPGVSDVAAAPPGCGSVAAAPPCSVAAAPPGAVVAASRPLLVESPPQPTIAANPTPNGKR